MLGIITYCLIIYLLGGIGASLGYHRILTHRVAIMPKWLEFSIVLLGLPAGTPLQWAGNHRAHHLHADKKGDPHSPHIDGFWYAHTGWYISTKNPLLCFLYAIGGPIRMFFDAFWRPRTNQDHVQLAEDLQEISFYRFVSKPIIYTTMILIYLVAMLSSAYLLFEWSGIFAVSLTLIIIYNLGDAVDSFGHLYGQKNGHSEARNNTILGILAFGDGWHANHHRRPMKAQHGIEKNQLDLSYLLLTFFKRIGLVKKIN